MDGDGEEGTWLYVVQIEMPVEREELFNRLYDEEHAPAILEVPGVRLCRRYRLD